MQVCPANEYQVTTPTLIYLGGDAYPDEADCEQRLASVVAESLGFSFVSQRSFVLGDEMTTGDWRSIPLRLTRAQEFISQLEGSVVVMGRSSGARVASLLDNLPQVKAIVCLAYPFKNPDHPPEESRYVHLASMSKPTLICQGVRDNYGGLQVTRMYQLSEAVELFFLNMCHGFGPSDEQLRLIVLRTKRFLDFLVK